MTAADIEMALVQHFNYRVNTIVPNVSWGMGLRYEADVVVLRPSGFAIEIEIKVTKSDIKRDLSKRWAHSSNLFRQLWFAVPQDLATDPNIPEVAGILGVAEALYKGKRGVTTIRGPKVNKNAVVWTPKQRQKLLELGCMRIWSLRQALRRKS